MDKDEIGSLGTDIKVCPSNEEGDSSMVEWSKSNPDILGSNIGRAH